MSMVFGRRKMKDRVEKGHPYVEVSGKRIDSRKITNSRLQASVSHALVVIFLEYFAWGLLTVPVINVSWFFLWKAVKIM